LFTVCARGGHRWGEKRLVDMQKKGGEQMKIKVNVRAGRLEKGR
jgi:hypothetical protein